MAPSSASREGVIIKSPPRSEPLQLPKLSIQDRLTMPEKLSTMTTSFGSEPSNSDNYSNPRRAYEYNAQSSVSNYCEIENSEASSAARTYRAVSCEIEEETSASRAPGAAADQTTAASSNVVVVVLDAEKKPSTAALDWAMAEVCKEGDEITVLAYLQHVLSPMGHKMAADLERFIGVNEACLVMTTSEKLDAIEYKIKETGRRQACQQRKIKLEVQIAPGSIAKSVIVREITAINATWVIFEKNTINDRKYFMEYLAFQNVVRMKSDGRSVETICQPSQFLQTSVSMASELSSYSSVDSPMKTFEQPTINNAAPPSFSPPPSSPSSLWGKLKSSMGSRRNNSSSSPTTSSRKYGRDQAQTPTTFNSLDGQLRSTMDNASSNTTAVTTNHQEVQPSEAGYYHHDLIPNEQKQDAVPEITFSPPRECSDQNGKTKYAHQEDQDTCPDVLSRYRRATRHRRVGNYVVV